MQLGRWAAPAALVISAMALSACAGGGTTPNLPGSGLNGVSGALHSAEGKRLTVVGIRSDVKCPAAFAQCFGYSISGGLDITWCYGPTSDPCADTDQITNWGGVVTSVKTAKTIKGIKVKWTGPFPCDGVRCTSGTYEDDAMKTGKRPPKQTAGKFKDEQIVTGCIGASCGNLITIGLSVGP